MLRVGIIIGSTRPGRKAEAVARWVYGIAQQRKDAQFELVDIKDFNLPLLDEPVPPSLAQYSKEHTKAWAAKIGSFDAYVFITPGSTITALPARSRMRSISCTRNGTTRLQDLSHTAAPWERVQVSNFGP